MQAQAQTTRLDTPLILPCGAVLKNRLVKSAISDSLGDGAGNPTKAQVRLYKRWAEGEIALSIIGEVQVDPRFPEKPGNLVLDAYSDQKALKNLTTQASIEGAHIWPQLGHAGALSHSPISQPKGPSRLSIEGLQCAGMSIEEVEQLSEQYANAAALAKKVGFTGVQIHAAHGFLLSQFLSPLFNHRKDQYGGSINARCKIIIDILARVRDRVGPDFPIGIKLNSSDQLQGGLSQIEALKVIKLLNQTSLDLIEISGGTYFPGATACSDKSSNQPYFIDFSKLAKTMTKIPLVVTGGFKKQNQAIAALKQGSADMIGLARATVLNPNLTKDWLRGEAKNPAYPRFNQTQPGGVTAWYTLRLTALAHDDETNFDIDLTDAVKELDTRDRLRLTKWRSKYS